MASCSFCWQLLILFTVWVPDRITSN